jgi:Skp family chaperone for outer membrane proteins
MLHQLGARLARAVLAVAFLFGGAGGVAAADAPKPPAPVVVIIDIQIAQRDAAAAQSARSQREQFMQRYQSEFEGGRKALKDSENDLMRQKATLSPEAWAQKAREFEQRVADYNRRYQGVLQAVEKSYAAAMNEVMATLIQVTEEVASEIGANLVMHKQQVFLHSPSMDVTPVVLERLNKRKSTVTFPTPKVEDAAAPAAKSGAKPGKK